ncbi:MAG: exodeoxyribonuclease V subunit gamma [Candidatus Sericytochromatia bacterium]|nr:exodeoxyribonuclease V subunit gamma [Candidatus Sericytochromatia bacterium]
MPLTLITHPQTEVLAADLAAWLQANPLPDPLAAERLLVAHAGTQAWLPLQLARHNGIAANLDLGFVSSGLWPLAHRLLPDLGWRSDFEHENLSWLLFAQLPELADTPGLEALRAYLQAQPDPTQRWQLAVALSRSFGEHALRRPAETLGWEAAPQEPWQARLWYHLLQQNPDLRTGHRARFWERLLQQLAAADFAWPEHLPQRLLIFDLPPLAPLYSDMLQALAAHLPVYIWQRTPAATDRLWQALNPPLQQAAAAHQTLPKSAPDAATDATPSLLQRLQTHLLAPDTPLQPGSADTSLSVHACHSALREVEVLCDQLQGLLRAHPALQAADLAVAVPDMALYGPLLASALGDAGLPFQLISPDPLSDSAICVAFHSLLQLPQSRLSLREVLQLLEQPPISASFGLEADTQQSLRQWLEAVEIRWGLDADHRQRLELPAFEAHSWRRGIERLLLGLALPDTNPPNAYADRLPYGQIEGSSSEILHRFLGFFDALEAAIDQLGQAHTLSDWQALLLQLSETFLGGVRREPAAREALRQLQARLRELAENPLPPDQPVGLGVIRAWLQEGSAQGSEQRFMSGGINLAPPELLQGLPFQVLAVLGLNVNTLPRPVPFSDLQLLSENDLQPGDLPRRLCDRSLWLDLLLGARQHLLLLYQGRRVRDNHIVPPALLLSELLDTVKALCPDFEVTEHALHPFDPRYFNGSLPRSHSPLQARLALAWRQGPVDALPPFDAVPLPPPEDSSLNLNDQVLQRFWRNPAAAFLRTRLDLYYPKAAPELAEAERFSFDSLESYLVKSDWLPHLLQASDTEQQGLQEHLRAQLKLADRLPIGPVAEAQLDRLEAELLPWIGPLKNWLGAPAPAETQSFSLQIGDWTLEGQLPQRYERGYVDMRPASLKGKDRLRAWLQCLLLQAVDPGNAFYWLSIEKTGPAILHFQPVADPLTLLEDLLQLRAEGLCQPLYFAPNTSWELWKGFAEKGDREQAQDAALKVWEDSNIQGQQNSLPGENKEPALARCLPAEWWTLNESLQLAQRVYEPLLRHQIEEKLP